jgi:hypothetical protein
VDETYIKVRGRWTYLYRAIDSSGDTVEFWFSERRNLPAAKRFLRKALTRHGRPEKIVTDGSQTNREAIISCDTANQLEDRSRRKLQPIRICQMPLLEQSDRAGSSSHQTADSADARVQVHRKRPSDPRWHRDGAHDAKGTGEVCPKSAIIACRSVRAARCIKGYEPLPDLFVRSRNCDRAGTTAMLYTDPQFALTLDFGWL